MRQLFKIVAGLTILILAYGCSGKGSNEEQILSKVVLSSNKSFIIANNSETAVLAVTGYDQDNNKMDAGKEIHIYMDGKETTTNSFKTDKTGEYIFSAKAGEFYTNEFKIKAVTQEVIDTEGYGIGKKCELYKSVNRDYEWYIDQYTTGSRNFENCGPTSATMAVKWCVRGFAGTPENARAKYKPSGGWWSTEDVTEYLNSCSVKNGIIAASNNREILKNIIDSEKIAILCIDASKIRYNSSAEERVDCYYQNGSGHFIIIKGYIECDGNLYFEVYDPNSWGAVYGDSTLKGKDRYYRYDDINLAMNTWWQYAIVVSPQEENSLSDIRFNYVDPKSIKHVRGR